MLYKNCKCTALPVVESCAGLTQNCEHCKGSRYPREDSHEERVQILVQDTESLRDGLLIYIASVAFVATLNMGYQPPVCKSWRFEPEAYIDKTLTYFLFKF